MRLILCTYLPYKAHAISALLAMLLLSILPRTAIGADPAKLAQKCSEGNQKACAKLVKMAKTNKSPGVRFSAVRYLTDQAALGDIARTDMDWQVRRLAVSALRDDAVLYHLVKSDPDAHLRWAAVRKIADQKLLVEIARTNSEEALRKAAVGKILDESVLAEIARGDASESVRKSAGELLGTSLTYQTLLLNLVTVERRPRWTIPALGPASKELDFLRFAEGVVQFAFACNAPCKQEDVQGAGTMQVQNPPGGTGYTMAQAGAGTRGAANLYPVWGAGPFGSPIFPVFTAAPEGWEMAVVRLMVRALPGHKETLHGHCGGVTDAAGNMYQQPDIRATFVPGLDYECGFAVPKDTELKTLIMDGFTFELDELGAKDGTDVQ